MGHTAPVLKLRTPTKFRALWDPPLGKVRFRVFHGGRSSAKSWNIARRLLVAGHEAKRRFLCTREFQASIKESVLELLAQQIRILNLSDVYEIETRRIVHRKTESTFLFAGLRTNPESIQSMEGVDIAWVEEAHRVSQRSWDILIPTIRRPGSEIWASFNPAEPTDPVWKMFVERKRKRSIVVPVSWRDNPWLPAEMLEELEDRRRNDPEGYAHIWEGQPIQRTDDKVLHGKVEVADFEPQPHWHGPYYGVDWGFSRDPTVITRQWIGDSRLWIDYDEHGLQVEMDALEALFDQVPGSRDHVLRADDSRPETISYLRNRKWRIIGVKKGPNSVEEGIAHLRSYQKIVLHPRCTLWEREARLYAYKRDQLTDDVLRQIIDANNHGIDSTRYGIEPIIQRSRQRLRPKVLRAGAKPSASPGPANPSGEAGARGVGPGVFGAKPRGSPRPPGASDPARPSVIFRAPRP